MNAPFRRRVTTQSPEDRTRAMDRLQLLKQLSFGSQVAEDEVSSLQEYFVRTEQWSRIERGDIDIVRGEKGAGKSALYLLLNKNKDDLFDKSVILVSGENPRGTTVFKDLIADPPATEREFIVLWKLYILVIACHEMRGYGIESAQIKSVYGALEEVGLLERELNLSGLLRTAQTLARRLLSPKMEAGVEIDAQSGAISGIIGRLSLAEPPSELRSAGISSLDGMFSKVNEALALQRIRLWVLLDRLDVAFAESHELEANAIRALIRVYTDFGSLEYISLKIFLREDIWKRVVEGFRESSHIVRYQVINWTNPMLLNVAMRRILNNDVLCRELEIDKEEILSDFSKQEAVFDRIFPKQVEQGVQKATTFNWMVGRCADGTGKTAPRELIHLLNSIKDEEIRRLELGGAVPPGEQLFDRSVFKLALPMVSSTRLNTYLYAEYKTERPFIEKMDGEKTEQTPDSLAEIWGLTREAALNKANDLVSIGLFERRGTKAEPTFWVPFLYRDALNLRQGKAELEGEISESVEPDAV